MPDTKAVRDPKAVSARPFRTAVQTLETIDYDVTQNLVATSVDLQSYQVVPNGYLTDMFLYVSATTAGNAAAVAFAADGPFSVLDTVLFEDVNSKPILGPLSGYELYCAVKYGGYSFQDDPKASPTYLATTGAGATGGSFGFVLRIPVQLVARDTLGSLPNKSSASQFRVRIRQAPSTAVYTTPPTTLPPVRYRITTEHWWQPDARSLDGAPQAQQPPAMGTTQYWSRSEYVRNPGAVQIPLERVGYLIRNLVFILRNNVGARVDADMPPTTTLYYEQGNIFDRPLELWRHKIAMDYGYIAAAEAANGRDNGVYPVPFTVDFGRAGQETRRGYLPTTSSTRLEFRGTIGGANAHTLVTLTNDVVPPSGGSGGDAAITV